MLDKVQKTVFTDYTTLSSANIAPVSYVRMATMFVLVIAGK
jgi:hypothetical protein